MSNSQPIGSHRFNVFIGIVGLLLAIIGNLVPHYPMAQKWLYFISAVLLLLSAILEKQLFFIVLEIVIVAGTAIAFTPLTLAWKAGLPILLSIAAIVYFIKQGLLCDGLMVLGSIGLALLAAGYATLNPVVYLLGGIVLALFSFASYKRGVQIALLWGILNAVFTVTAGIEVFNVLTGG